MPFTLQMQAKTASNLTTCVIVRGAHASQLPIPKDKQEDCVVVASGVGSQLVSHPDLDIWILFQLLTGRSFSHFIEQHQES